VTLFIGWDVGAWNCDGGKSRDALCALTGTRWDDLRLAAPPWRGNLRKAIVEGDCPYSILSVLELESPKTLDTIVAIDTPLGWPSAFTSLLAGSAQLSVVGGEVHANPYVFRRTEQALVARGLFPSGRTPLSTVRDMIGSQSSKALYFLRKAGMTQRTRAVWTTPKWTAIETYPTPVRTSRMLQPHFERLRSDPGFVKCLKVARAAADVNDSLWCALVAATWAFSTDALVPAPENDVIASEGWIWVPSDCTTPIGAADGEVGVGHANE
jgi:hypothetical protein